MQGYHTLNTPKPWLTVCYYVFYASSTIKGMSNLKHLFDQNIQMMMSVRLRFVLRILLIVEMVRFEELVEHSSFGHVVKAILTLLAT